MGKEAKIFHLISSLRRGGRERQLSTIIKNTDLNHKVIVFNKVEASYVDEYEISDKIVYLKNKRTLKRFFEMVKLIRTHRVNLVWSWGGFEATFGLILSIFTNVKHINGSIRHGIVLINRKQIWRLIILQLSKFRVANSHAGLNANKLRKGYVLYNGIDDSFFIQNKDQSVSERKTINLISVANLVPYKDYSTTLEALAILKRKKIKFHYFIVGEGPERPRIENEVKNLGLICDVTLFGLRFDIQKLLANSDIFIHSSRGEGCSNSIIEALAVGLPVVATNTGGTKEIIAFEYGRLFNYKDRIGLSVYLEEIILNSDLRASMGKNAKDMALATFSVQSMINHYLNIVNNVSNK